MMRAPEEFRVTGGHLGSDPTFGNNGFFRIPFESYELRVIASNG